MDSKIFCDLLLNLPFQIFTIFTHEMIGCVYLFVVTQISHSLCIMFFCTSSLKNEKKKK